MSILTIDHISKYYNLDGTNQERALNDVTLGIAPGKITAIYGPSGCGKTSLLSIISGLDSQSQENVLEIFKELAEAGKTVIIVTHNPEVADYADVVIKMKDGEVVETIEK